METRITGMSSEVRRVSLFLSLLGGAEFTIFQVLT